MGLQRNSGMSYLSYSFPMAFPKTGGLYVPAGVMCVTTSLWCINNQTAPKRLPTDCSHVHAYDGVLVNPEQVFVLFVRLFCQGRLALQHSDLRCDRAP
ncbi:hypothetical protein D3C87_1255820 [compost metagenome]